MIFFVAYPIKKPPAPPVLNGKKMLVNRSLILIPRANTQTYLQYIAQINIYYITIFNKHFFSDIEQQISNTLSPLAGAMLKSNRLKEFFEYNSIESLIYAK